MIIEIINELKEKLADLQKQMDEAKTIEDWLKAYREYLGVFLKLQTARTYEGENNG